MTDDILSKLQLPGCSTYDELGNPTIQAEINLQQRAIDPQPNGEGNQRLLQYHESSPHFYSTHSSDNANLRQPPVHLPQQTHASISPSRREQTPPEHDGTEDDEDTLVTEPMGSLYEVTKLQKFRRRAHRDAGSSTMAEEENRNDDLISRGILSLEEAEELFI